MPTYTPSFNNPITKNLKISDSLIVSPSATGPFSMFAATNSFNAESNTSYNWTVDSASQTITLPLTPVNGAYVVITDIDYSWGNYSPSVDYNGASSKGAAGSSSDLSAFVGGELKFIYSSSNNEWTSWKKPATTDNPFHGWWKPISKTQLPSGANADQSVGLEPTASGYTIPGFNIDNMLKTFTYFYLDCISNYPQIKLTSYGGTYNEVYEAWKIETSYELLSNDSNTVSIAVAGIYGTESFDPLQYFLFQNLPTYFASPVFTIQSSNPNILFAGDSTFTDPTFTLSVYPQSTFCGLLERMNEPPVIRPYNNNEISFPDSQDPIYMFNYYFNILNEKGMYGNTPLNGQEDEWYPGYYNQQKILNEYLQGKTEEYPIHHIIKSTTSQYQPSMDATMGNLTGATRIFLGNNHIVTKGSTITISGFSGEWSVLNGTYDNDVIQDYHWNTQSTGHFDCDPVSLSGSFYNATNSFVLRLDTSSLTGVSTGPYNGWGVYAGTPMVSVTHHVTSDMTYNNFIAALKACMLESYGSIGGALAAFFLTNNTTSGRISSNWDTTSQNYTRGSGLSGFGVDRSAGTSRFYNRFGSNLGSVAGVPRVYGDHYDVLNNIVTYITGANTSGWSIPALNYLDPNETYNLYYAFDGDYSTGPVGYFNYDIGVIQQDLGENYYGVQNLSNPNLLGGGMLVFTGAKYYGYTGASVDTNIWIIADYDAVYNPTTNLYYNMNIFGLIRSELTNGKKIGYLYLGEIDNAVDTAKGPTFNNAFNLFADKEVLSNCPDKTTNGQFALKMLPVMKYFNSQGVDGIILDFKSNPQTDNYYFNITEQFFGGDRLKISTDYFYLATKNQLSPLLNIKDYEYYLNLNQTGSDNYLHPSFLESPQGYGTGAVYHGSENTGARVVLLTSENTSTPVFMSWGMLGDNLDGDIGNNTKVKFLGASKAYNTHRNILPLVIPTPYIEETIRGTSTIGGGLAPVTYPAPTIKLSTGMSGSITLTAMNQINDYTAISEMTSITGAFTNTFGNAFPIDMETRVYPDFGFVENTRPRLPGDSRPQQPDPTVSGTWRDSWLEASIAEITLGTW